MISIFLHFYKFWAECEFLLHCSRIDWQLFYTLITSADAAVCKQCHCCAVTDSCLSGLFFWS